MFELFICAGQATTCEKERDRIVQESNRRPLVGKYIPQCDNNGGKYHKMQCHGATGFCWCVDSDEKEVAKTRVQGKPDCSLVVRK